MEKNIFYHAKDKAIILFGAGRLAIDYIRRYGGIYEPVFIVDNDEKKWGTTVWNIPVFSPDKLMDIPKDKRQIVICSIHKEEIQKQLKALNENEWMVYDKTVDYMKRMLLSDRAESLSKYSIGYVPGVFDLYHVGHLNLLKRSKERCNHLIAGILTDELVFYFKKKYPCIPFEERIAIIESVRYVDEVVPVDHNNTIKMEAWKQLKFDCHFSGDDHICDWDVPLKALRQVGSNMEFFPYTKTINSTQIREKLRSQ